MSTTKKHRPWNAEKAVGQMKALTPDQVETIRRILEQKGDYRGQALFSTAIDTMLRACDLLKLTVADVTDADGSVKNEFMVRQKKTGKGVKVTINARTVGALEQWINKTGKMMEDWLFTGLRRSKDRAISREQYRVLVKSWVVYAGLDPVKFSTHSLRRTKAAHIYNQTQNPEAVRLLLGQSSITATSRYLGLEQNDAIELARRFEI
ncbi:MAG: tyrosine-type recombinase/integrase [Magnetococcales bacterium]|nr:tyrosine-type recombinase/integrase [Magnetococcales bacterium]